ncbi:MAG: PhzF family phenazine biosynthesis protein [Acetobacteraceae bacterium]
MHEMVSIDYVTLDVFTGHAFGGNPLAVIADARGLTDAEMQAIAGEFNYSETTFVLPPADARAAALVRIFMPSRELPFAGHPNVGTAFVTAAKGELFGRRLGDEFLFEEKAGLVRISIRREHGAVAGATLAAPQALVIGRSVAAKIVAGCVGLEPGDLKTGDGFPVVASVGLPFLFAELKDRGALARSRPTVAFAQQVPGLGADAIHLFVREGTRVAARMFFGSGAGVIEDPATGSANVALAALLAERLSARDAELALEISQGEDMGRPSRLQAHAVKRDGRIERAEIGGQCIEMMRGRLCFARRRA